jgi:arylsulfatase A-like enzyme
MLPFRLPEELVVEPVVRNVDVWPTVLDLVGLPPLPGADGVSLVPLMEAAARKEVIETPKSLAFIDQTWGLVDREPAPLFALRDDGKRLLFRPKTPETSEIYDLTSDPGEKRNLRSTPPEWVEPFQQELQTYIDQPVPWGEATEVSVDDMRRHQLRALGYVIPPGPAKEQPAKEQD